MSDTPPSGPAVFLERRSYRIRRLRDAARLLPWLGLFFWTVPLLWPRGTGDAPGTSGALIYIFSVWAGLVCAGALLSSRMAAKGEPATDEPRDGPLP